MYFWDRFLKEKDPLAGVASLRNMQFRKGTRQDEVGTVSIKRCPLRQRFLEEKNLLPAAGTLDPPLPY